MTTIVRKRTWDFFATAYDSAEVPTNHTGWIIRAQIRTRDSKNRLIATLNVFFPSPTTGEFQVQQSRAFTEGLPLGTYVWDIVATDASGRDHTYLPAEPIEILDAPSDPSLPAGTDLLAGELAIEEFRVLPDTEELEIVHGGITYFLPLQRR